MVEVLTKDIGDVKDVRKKEVGYSKTFEDRCEDYIKFNMKVRG